MWARSCQHSLSVTYIGNALEIHKKMIALLNRFIFEKIVLGSGKTYPHRYGGSSEFPVGETTQRKKSVPSFWKSGKYTMAASNLLRDCSMTGLAPPSVDIVARFARPREQGLSSYKEVIAITSANFWRNFTRVSISQRL